MDDKADGAGVVGGTLDAADGADDELQVEEGGIRMQAAVCHSNPSIAPCRA